MKHQNRESGASNSHLFHAIIFTTGALVSFLTQSLHDLKLDAKQFLIT